MPHPRPTIPADVRLASTRTVVVSYPTEGGLTLAHLRDFVYRTRNQHGVPNWPAEALVMIRDNGDDVVLSVSASDEAEALAIERPTRSVSAHDVPLPLDPIEA